MSEPQPARRRFQIHGFTVLVLVCVAGGLLWANFKPVIPAVNTHIDYLDVDMYYGWPTTCASYSGPHYSKRNQVDFGWDFFKVNWSSFAFNFLVAIILLTLTWRVCEWVIYKPAASPDK
jgi:hypothetical protein